ncbi:MAG: DUF262 domain-containing protein [Flavobacteriaceae bacterium]|jgi:uncharacterized protein with ParB-like and HNH nuclease domain|nr:DUF262 domain-containing protein [Flavobacteriaceae bacterium]
MNIITFEEVFNGKVFRIPDYQRGYSWTKKELEELWADLSNTHHNRNAFHFTGILTLTDFSRFDIESVRKEGFVVRSGKLLITNKAYSGFNIVDGQQRLTTLLILLSELVLALDEGDIKTSLINQYFKVKDQGYNRYLFGYHVDVPSHNYLIREIFNDTEYDIEETETLYTHNLSFAKRFFGEHIAKFSQVELSFWINKITKHLLFSILNLNESEKRPLDVSMVFETLNFRGKQLSSLERLKNRVLYIVSKQLAVATTIERSRKRVNQSWLEVYKWLGRNPTQAMDDDAFLKAFWLLYFSHSKMVSTDFKSYQKHLFTIDFQLEEGSKTINYADYQELTQWLDSMKKAVVLWYFINNPYAIDTDEDFLYFTTINIQKSLQHLITFPRGYGKYMLNLALAVLMRELPTKENHGLSERELEERIQMIERLLFAMERHNIMCFLLQGNNSNLNQEDTFRDINFYYLRGRAHNNEYLLNILMETRVEHFRWKEVIRHIHKVGRFKTWAGLDYFLKTLEEDRGGMQEAMEPKVYLIYPEDDDYEVRSTYKDINSMQKVNRDRYSHSIGNMFLAYNRYEASSFDKVKHKVENALKNEYRVSMLERELLNYSIWTKESIENRGRSMMEAFIEKWELPMIQDTEMKRLLLDEM